jgi:hypothetical protein
VTLLHISPTPIPDETATNCVPVESDATDDQVLDGAKSCSFQLIPEFVLVYIFPALVVATNCVPVESDAIDVQVDAGAPVLVQELPELVLLHIDPAAAGSENEAATIFDPLELKAKLLQPPVGVFGDQLPPELMLTYNCPPADPPTPNTNFVPSGLEAMGPHLIDGNPDALRHVVPEFVLI